MENYSVVLNENIKRFDLSTKSHKLESWFPSYLGNQISAMVYKMIAIKPKQLKNKLS